VQKRADTCPFSSGAMITLALCSLPRRAKVQQDGGQGVSARHQCCEFFSARNKCRGDGEEPLQVLWPCAVWSIKYLGHFICKHKKLHLLGYKKPAKSPGFGLISKCFSIDR